MTVLAVGGLAAVWLAGHPGASSQLWLWLLPGVALLATGSLVDSSGVAILATAAVLRARSLRW